MEHVPGVMETLVIDSNVGLAKLIVVIMEINSELKIIKKYIWAFASSFLFQKASLAYNMRNKIYKITFLLIGIFFLVSSILKLTYPENIKIFGYKYLDKFIYIMLIQIECILGILLLIKPNKLTIYSGIVLISSFTFYALIKVLTGTDSNCGCIGTIIQRDPAATLTENLILVILYINALFLQNNKYGIVINKLRHKFSS